MALNSNLRINVLLEAGKARAELKRLQGEIKAINAQGGLGGRRSSRDDAYQRQLDRQEARRAINRYNAQEKARQAAATREVQARAREIKTLEAMEAQKAQKLMTINRRVHSMAHKEQVKAAAAAEAAEVKKAAAAQKAGMKITRINQNLTKWAIAEENKRVAAAEAAAAKRTAIAKAEAAKVRAAYMAAMDTNISGRQLKAMTEHGAFRKGRGGLIWEALFGKHTLRDLSRAGAVVGGTANKLTRAFTRIGIAARVAEGGVQRFGNRAINAGRQMQWLGRQVEFRLTLPFLALGAVASALYLSFDKAFTRFAKVLGDVPEGDLDKYKEFFIELSNTIGKSAEDVANAAGIFAQAGLAGDALVGATIQAGRLSILTGQDLAAATESLITIQKAWKFSTEELGQAINVLNRIENEEAVSIEQLIVGLQKAGNIAIDSGVSFGELASMIATLVPATGGAEEAGTALKTMLQQLGALTPQAEAMMLQLLGSAEALQQFKDSTGLDQFKILAEAMMDISDSQVGDVLREIFNLRQTNKASQLIRDLQNAMDDTGESAVSIMEKLKNLLGLDIDRNFGDIASNAAVAAKEIETFLGSDSQQFAVALERVKNTLIEIGGLIVPVLITIADVVSTLIDRFNGLDDATKKNILKWAAFLILGVSAISVLGALIIMIGAVVKTFAGLAFFLGSSATWMLPLAATIVMVIDHFAALQQAAMAMARTMAAVWRGIVGIISAAANAIISIINVIISAFGALFGIFGGGSSSGTSGRAAGGVVPGARRGGIVPALAAGTDMVPIRKVAGGFETHGASAIVGEGNARYPEYVVPTDPKYRRRATALTQKLVGELGGGGSTVSGLARGGIVPGLASGGITFGTKLQRRLGMAEGRLEIFLDATVDIRAELSIREFDKSREGLAEVAPELLPDFDKLLADLMRFRREAEKLEAAIKDQVAVVKEWEAALAAIDDELEEATDALREMQDAAAAIEAEIAENEATISRLGSMPLTGMHAAEDAIFANTQAQRALRLEILRMEQAGSAYDAIQDEIEDLRAGLEGLNDAASRVADEIAESEQALSDLAQTPIAGMGAMEDAIFANEMAQKNLRLEMLRLEEAEGPIEDTQEALSKLSGDIENLRARRTDLRLAGAGQDILSVLDDQIADLDAARRELMSGGGGGTSTELDELQRQLDELTKEGQILQLEYEIDFDPLTREIDEALNGMPEMSFDTIMGGISTHQARLEILEAEADVIDAQIEAQEALIEAAEARADAEGDALEALQDQLRALQIEGEIMQIEFDMEFEPLQREIDRLINGTEEMSFDEIVAGILEAQANIAALQPELDALNESIAAQEDLIKSIEEEREGILESLEAERDILADLEEDYQGLLEVISDIEEALRGFDALLEVGGAGGGGGAGGAGGLGEGVDFEDLTGSLDDLSKDFTAEMEQIKKEIVDAFGIDTDKLNEDLDKMVTALQTIAGRIESIFSNPVIQAIGAVVLAITALGAIGGIFGFMSEASAVVRGLGMIWTVLTNLSTAWVALRIALLPVGAALAAVSTPVWVVIGVIVALVAAFVILWQTSETFRDIVRGVLDWFASAAGVAAEAFMAAWAGLGAAFAGLWGIISGVLEYGVDLVRAALDAIWFLLEPWVSLIVNLFEGDLNQAFMDVVDILTRPFILAYQILEGVFQWIIDAAQWLWQDLQNFGSNIATVWGGVVAVWDAAWAGISATISAIWDGIRGAASWLWQDLLTLGSNIAMVWNGVTAAWDMAWAGVAAVLAAVRDWAQAWWTEAWGDISGNVATVWNGISAAWGAAWGTITGILSGAWDAVSGFMETFVGLFSADSDIGTGFATIGPAFSAIGDAVSLMGDALLWLIDVMAELIDAGLAFVDWLVGTFQASIEVVADVLAAVWDGLAGVWQAVWDGLQLILQTFWTWLTTIFQVGLSTAMTTITNIWNGVSAVWNTAYAAMQLVLQTFWTWLTTIFQVGLATAAAIVGAVWDGISALWGGVWGGIQAVLRGVTTWVTTTWQALWSGAATTVGAVWSGVSGAFSTAWAGARSVLEGISTYVTGTFSTAFSTAAGVIGAAFDGVRAAWNGILGVTGTARSVLVGARTWVRGTFQSAWTTAGSVVGGAFDGISSAFSTAWGAVTGALTSAGNAVIRVVNRFIDGVNVIPGVNIGRISELARGGIVPARAMATGGTVPVTQTGSGFTVAMPTAIVGEGSRHYEEYVIPTDPKYRQNAMALHAGLSSRLGIPGYASGGVVGSSSARVPAAAYGLGPFGDWVDSALDAGMSGVSTIARWARDRVIDAALAIARPAMNLVPAVTLMGRRSQSGVPRQMGRSSLEKFAHWIRTNNGVGRGIMDAVQRIIDEQVASRPHPGVSDSYLEQGQEDTFGVLTEDRNSPPRQTGPNTPIGFGGIVPATPGGFPALLSERGSDEAVIPLPRDFDPDKLGHTTININGDLSFPNIDNDASAEEFIANLESLVGRK